MNVTVNGEPRDVGADLTIAGLIRMLGLKPELTAVQVNDEILERTLLSEYVLSEGDVVELIRIVGGG